MCIRDSPRTSQASQQLSNVITALKGYELEYGELPQLGDGSADSEWIPLTEDSETGFALVNALIFGSNEERGWNPREISFFEPKYRDDPRGGFLEEGDDQTSAGLYDPWGNAIFVKLDADGDGFIVPFPGDEPLQKTVIAMSPGEEAFPGNLRGGKRPIYSWKR